MPRRPPKGDRRPLGAATNRPRRRSASTPMRPERRKPRQAEAAAISHEGAVLGVPARPQRWALFDIPAPCRLFSSTTDARVCSWANRPIFRLGESVFSRTEGAPNSVISPSTQLRAHGAARRSAQGSDPLTLGRSIGRYPRGPRTVRGAALESSAPSIAHGAEGGQRCRARSLLRQSPKHLCRVALVGWP